MKAWYNEAHIWLEQYPDLYSAIILIGLLLAAWLANFIVKRILLRGVFHIVSASPVGHDPILMNSHVISRLANIVPSLVVSTGISAISDLPEALVSIVRNVCTAFIVLSIALAISGVLTIVNSMYQRRPDAHIKPIKGFVQVFKILVFVIAAILIIASLIDRSPLILLSGLGAMAAVLMLIFQDTLLSLVASVQISSGDMLRVGDWIEMPQLNADGDVIDIALHTVRIQNFDKTITTIPTKRLITDPFKNWRGMQESGGRRIKRSLFIDQTSVRFLTPDEIEHLRNIKLLEQYLNDKQSELHEWNSSLEEARLEPANTRRVTNIGTFRAYIESYLRKNAEIHPNMTQMVRQLQPTAEGLPLELYCFTSTVNWIEYELIQSDIFDHLLAILPEFGLRVFQNPSGADMRELKSTPQVPTAP